MGNTPSAPVRDEKGSKGLNCAELLEVSSGTIIQELGWDEDCDSSISEALEDAIGEELLGPDTD